MALPAISFPLRVKCAGTDPVHAARSIQAGGHNTACLVWLTPEAPHQWLSENVETTCSKCLKRITQQGELRS